MKRIYLVSILLGVIAGLLYIVYLKSITPVLNEIVDEYFERRL